MHIHGRDHSLLRRLNWNYCANSVNVYLIRYGVTMAQKCYTVYCLRCAQLLGIPHDMHNDMTCTIPSHYCYQQLARCMHSLLVQHPAKYGRNARVR